MDENELSKQLKALKLELEAKGKKFDDDIINSWIMSIRSMGKGYILAPNIEEFIKNLKMEFNNDNR